MSVLRSCLKTFCATTLFPVLMKPLCNVLNTCRDSQPGAGSTCGEGQNLSFLQLPRLSRETHPHRASDVLCTVEFTQETVFTFVSKT